MGRPLLTHANGRQDRGSMDEQNPNDELYPIAVLIDELKVRYEQSSLNVVGIE